MWLQTSLSVSVWYIKDQLGVQISVDVFSICTLNSGLPLNCSNVTSVEKVEILDPRPGQAGAWPPQQPIRGDAGSWKQRPAFRRGTGNENNEPPSRHVNHVWQTDSERRATQLQHYLLTRHSHWLEHLSTSFPYWFQITAFLWQSIIKSDSKAASERLQTSPACLPLRKCQLETR